MKRITATLPTLGTVPVDFHRESEEVLEFMGDKELRRLRTVPHLGVVSSVFTGVNHSRLEYLMLQCAVIGLVAKLHRNNEEFALSGKVNLNGISTPISSGEELLKVWALLSNYGRPQYTYGVERGLAQWATRDPLVKDWFTNTTRLRDLRLWCNDAITEYKDVHFHYVVALFRIAQLKPRDRRKTKYAHYLRNLLLPVGALIPNDNTAQYKLNRLRNLFLRIRLLSMVTLDSYYSQHPISIQLNSILLSLANLTSSVGTLGGFDRLLAETSGWLADELYLHPDAVATQREYEIRASIQLPTRFAKASTVKRRISLFNDLVGNGLGRPLVNALKPLLRLSFDGRRQQLLGQLNLFETTQQLEKDLASPPATYVSVDKNPFTGFVHVDILFRADTAALSDIAQIYTKIQAWLIRSLEAAALANLRRVIPLSARTGTTTTEDIRRRFIDRRVDLESDTMYNIFASFISYLLPDDRKGIVSEFLPVNRIPRPILAKFIDSTGEVFDQVLPQLQVDLNQNPKGLSPDRLQELRALEHVVKRSKAPFLLVCAEKFIIQDQLGNAVNEWDGALIEFSDDEIRITIVEAKNLGSNKKNENQAFAQLVKIRDLLRNKNKIEYRRRRISKLGAEIRFTLDVPPSAP